MNERYVVACDSEYYSSVRFCTTREEADGIAAEWEAENGTGQSYGPELPRIVVAEILHTIPLPLRSS